MSSSTESPTLAPSALVPQISPSESPTPLPSSTTGPTFLPTSSPTLSFKPTPRPTVTVQPTLSSEPTQVPTLFPTYSQLPTITPQPSLILTPPPTVRCEAFPEAIGCWPDANWRLAVLISALCYLFLLGLLVLLGIMGRVVLKRREKAALKKARGGISRVASEMDLLGLADGGALSHLEMMDDIVLDYGESEVSMEYSCKSLRRICLLSAMRIVKLECSYVFFVCNLYHTQGGIRDASGRGHRAWHPL